MNTHVSVMQDIQGPTVKRVIEAEICIVLQSATYTCTNFLCGSFIVVYVLFCYFYHCQKILTSNIV